jgi:putative protease
MESQIGRVTHFYKKISVAIVKLSDSLLVGDTVHISGHTTDLTQTIDSMQMEHQNIEKAEKGQTIGIKVNDEVRVKDIVFKVTD